MLPVTQLIQVNRGSPDTVTRAEALTYYLYDWYSECGKYIVSGDIIRANPVEMSNYYVYHG